jgi:hypothetical protein
MWVYLLGMWWSFIHILYKAFSLSLTFMGTTAIAVLIGFLVFVSREIYVWHYQGMEAVKTRWPGSARFGFLVTVLLWACLFAFCVAKAIYDDHQSLVTANVDKLQVIANKNKTIQELEAKLKESPKVIYREKQTPGVTDTSSRHLTKVQTVRLTRMFSELPLGGVSIVVKTIADNQEALQYASEINSALENGRSIKSFVNRGSFWQKIPEGVLICTYSDTDPQVNAVAERIAREMIALGIAVILNPDSSFPKNTVTILVGAKAIE